MLRSILTLTAALFLVVATAGCTARNNKQLENDLKQIGIAYHNHCDATRKAPEKADDLAPYLENDQRILGLLRSGAIVFQYGVSLIEMTQQEGSALTILAYAKE